MSLVTLKQRIEEGVQERLVPALFDKVKASHCKRDWHNCPCSYCAKKRILTQELRVSPYWMNRHDRLEWRDKVVTAGRTNLKLLSETIVTARSKTNT